MDDTIGKFGLESAMEQYLRGTNGVESTITDSSGSKTTEITTEPVQGDTVILTIDSDLQLAVQELLRTSLHSIRIKRACLRSARRL